MSASAAHVRLREATAADHARVDGCFAQGLHDDASYRRYVQGMHALPNGLALGNAGLASMYAEPRERLEQDLSALGAAPLSPAYSLNIGASDAARLGARYVVEGSALGARVLFRQAEALGHTSANGARFLAYHVGRSYTHWPLLVQALTVIDPDAPEFQTALTAARDTFALAAACFDPMGSVAKETDEGPHGH